MVEVSLTVGKLDASLALLLTQEHHLIEFPTILLPNGVKAGSIVTIRCERDLESETREQQKLQAIQDEILETYGKNLPSAPALHVKNVTQTSCVLEWGALDLGTASLKSVVLYKDGQKLGPIPNPLNNCTSKVSGLSIDRKFTFQLKMDTTAGMYVSEPVEVTTHKMTDLSGINVCLGHISAGDGFTADDIQAALKSMGAHYPASEKVQVDTTHYVTTRENKSSPEFAKANEMNIPVIRPEWLKACERERRIVGVRDFYVKDCVLPDIIERGYWKTASATAGEHAVPTLEVSGPEAEAETEAEAEAEAEAETETEAEAEAEAVEATEAAETVEATEAAESVEATETAETAEPTEIRAAEIAEAAETPEASEAEPVEASGEDKAESAPVETDVTEPEKEADAVETEAEPAETQDLAVDVTDSAPEAVQEAVAESAGAEPEAAGAEPAEAETVKSEVAETETVERGTAEPETDPAPVSTSAAEELAATAGTENGGSLEDVAL